MKRPIVFFLALLLLLSSVTAWAESPKPATQFTIDANNALLSVLPFSDRQDFKDASRGFIATIPDGKIYFNDKVVWDMDQYSFLDSDNVPDTVNPSLWRIGQLNRFAGLFKVTDKVYQYRGFDVANMSIVETDTGIIIIDPLISASSAKAGLDLYYQHVPSAKNKNGHNRPIKAVIYTHPHADHFGGVQGVLGTDPAKYEGIKIIAPYGFLEHAVSENLYAGNVMLRRGMYMYGRALPKEPRGNVGIGLGTATTGVPIAIVPPTDFIKESGEKTTIDGLEMTFEVANESEAPVEIMVYFPQLKAFCAAEVTNSTIHNLYTLRGAQIRNGTKWSRYIDNIISKYADKTDVIFGSHHWPHWGKESFVPFLKAQRDLYKFTHDQTLRLANLGYTPVEIAEMLKFPESLQKTWYARGYYGTLNHNSKAVYQMYLGWYDGNPANLNPLPPEEQAVRYVEYMGGANEIIKKARNSYEKGDYRWVAEVMKHVVFADPKNQEARNLYADALEQMGYQAEAGTWRSIFLYGAKELREGMPKLGVSTFFNPDTMRAMTPEMVLDYFAIKLNPERSDGKKLSFIWQVNEKTPETWGITMENCVLNYRKDMPLEKSVTRITSDKASFIALMTGQVPYDELVKSGKIKVEGNKETLTSLIPMFDEFDLNLNIVLP